MSILCGVYIGVAFTPIGSHFRIENLQVRFVAKANMIATARREAPRPLSRSTNTPPALRSKLMQSVSALPPESRLVRCSTRCLLWAKSGHWPDQMVSLDALYYPGRYHEYGTD